MLDLINHHYYSVNTGPKYFFGNANANTTHSWQLFNVQRCAFIPVHSSEHWQLIVHDEASVLYIVKNNSDFIISYMYI